MSNKAKLVSTAAITPEEYQAPAHARHWRIGLWEACPPEDKGSIGCNYVMRWARRAGWNVEYEPDGPVDIELVSVHHASDYPMVAAMPRRGKIRIVGGYACLVNPRPVIPFADVVLVGEGETWILLALRALAEDGRFRPEALRGLPSTIITRDWEYGAPIPPARMEFPIPKNEAYLNREAKGHAPTWYLEMARGCPFRCHYCSLGNLTRYRLQETDFLLDQLERLDRSKSNRVSLFAPDEASHPGYGEILQKIHDLGLITQFGSMRIEQIMRRNLPLRPNMLIRVGMDGLTEETRFRVGRMQSDEYFIEYFRYMSDRGHANFKVFMIVGYPWEKPEDLDHWISLMSRIGSLPRRNANAHVRIKITPLIPMPGTPLEHAEAKYDFQLITRMQDWIRAWRPPRSPGWFFEQDGTVMSYRNWKRQCELVKGDETILLGEYGHAHANHVPPRRHRRPLPTLGTHSP